MSNLLRPSRRAFLFRFLTAGSATVLAACSSAAPSATTAPKPTTAAAPTTAATAAAKPTAAAGTTPAASATAAATPVAGTTPAAGATPAAGITPAASAQAALPSPTPPAITASKAGAANLEFWTINLKGPYGNWIQDFIKRYESANEGTKITWVDVPGAEVAQKYLAAVSAKQAPDVANIYEVPRIIELNAVADLNQLVDEKERSDYIEGLWNAYNYSGKVYAMPWYAGTGGLVYSRKNMQAAGLNPDQPPKTWDDILDQSKQIKDKTQKYGLLMTVGQGESLDLLQHHDIPILSDDHKKAALNTPAAVDLLSKWQKFYRDKYLPPEATTANPRDAVQWYYADRGTYYTGGPVVLVKRADPAVIQKEDTDVAPSITGPKNFPLASLQIFVISAMSKNPPAAADFALYVTGKQLQEEFIWQVPILPSRKSVLDDPYFRKRFIEPKFSGRTQQELLDRGFQISLGEIEKAKVLYNSAPPVVQWQRMFDVFKREENKMYATGQGPDVTLKNIEAEWNKILSGG